MISKLLGMLEPPDPSLVEAGAGGEKLVAKTRLIFWVFIGLAPLSSAIAGRREAPIEVWISLAAVVIAIVLSAMVVVLLRGGSYVPMIGFVTGAGDATIVTLTLAAIAFAGRPNVAVDSRVAWAVYLLAILATSLRFDMRICLFVGLLTIAEYSALLVFVALSWGLPIMAYQADASPGIGTTLQAARLMIMLAATAIAMGVVFRSRQLVYASGTDRLTGLGNRAYFDERLRAELARAARTGGTLALAFFDIDHFKRFNDRLGHEAGDEALRRVARVMREESRQEDILARWGGEEIVLVLPETRAEGAMQKAERIRERLASEALVFEGKEASLTVSCGLAQYPKDGTDASSLLGTADRRLLAAKRAGRNRVVMADVVAKLP